MEFEYFREYATKDLIMEIVNRNPLANDVIPLTNFICRLADSDTIEIGFGKRGLSYPNIQGQPILENGSKLLYSLSAFGPVAIVLYPCTSALMSTHEKHVFLRHGRFTGHQLRSRLDADLKRLVDYHYLTSEGLQASWRQWLWYQWIRIFKAKGTAQGFQRASVWKWGWGVAGFLGGLAAENTWEAFLALF